MVFLGKNKGVNVQLTASVFIGGERLNSLHLWNCM